MDANDAPEEKQLQHNNNDGAGVELMEQRMIDIWSNSRRTFHYILLASCILAPLSLVIAFISATYVNGKTITCCSISNGIAYHQEFDANYYGLLTVTIVSSLLQVFVTVCRQIQIKVKFEEYREKYHINQHTVSTYCWLNRIALFFNLSGYLSIILLVRYDSQRYPVHTLFSSYTFVASELFLLFTAIITIKQRRIEYDNNIVIYNGNKKSALSHSFVYDGVIMAGLFVIGSICSIVYVIAFIHLPEAITTDKQVEPYGNVAEWLAFIALISGVCVLALSFHHDNVDDELMTYFLKLYKEITHGCKTCNKYNQNNNNNNDNNAYDKKNNKEDKKNKNKNKLDKPTVTVQNMKMIKSVSTMGSDTEDDADDQGNSNTPKTGDNNMYKPNNCDVEFDD